MLKTQTAGPQGPPPAAKTDTIADGMKPRATADPKPPSVPAPDLHAAQSVRHVLGTRPVLDIVRECVETLEKHLDCRILMFGKGAVPRVAPGVVDGSQGFADTPLHNQHTLELRIAYRDSVTPQARGLGEVAQAQGETAFERKWGGLVKAGAEQPTVGPRKTPAAPFAYDHVVPKREVASA